MRAPSLGAAREFLGEFIEDVTGMINQVEVAGGFDEFVKGHEIYSAMAGEHLATACTAYHNSKMRGALRLVRLTLEDEGIVGQRGLEIVETWLDAKGQAGEESSPSAGQR